MEWNLKQQGFEGKKGIALLLIILALLALWVPVSIDKITGFVSFQESMIRQPFADWMGKIASYALPVLEVITVICLLTEKYRKIGLILSTALMTVFTGYIGIALLGAWEKLPCGCGSVITGMNWTQHFFFNLAFLAISGAGIYLWYNLQGSNAGSEATEGGSAKRHIKNFSLTTKI